MKPEHPRVKKRQFMFFLALALIFVPLASFSQENGPDNQIPESEVARMLIRAEGHHDLAVLYIEKGELEKAIAEARQIIQLELPPEFEKYVAQSLSIITESLAEIGRFDMAQALLDESLETTKEIPNKARIYRTKARLFMLAGDNDMAIDSWRKALDLESKGNP